MKKLLLLGAFVAFAFVGAQAQTVSAAPNTDVATVNTPKEEKPANGDKKEKKHKKSKSCGEGKEKSCSGGEKKSCCGSKGHTTEAPAPKQEGK